MLALKLLVTDRYAHMGDHGFDPGLWLFAGLNCHHRRQREPLLQKSPGASDPVGNFETVLLLGHERDVLALARLHLCAETGLMRGRHAWRPLSTAHAIQSNQIGYKWRSGRFGKDRGVDHWISVKTVSVDLVPGSGDIRGRRIS